MTIFAYWGVEGWGTGPWGAGDSSSVSSPFKVANVIAARENLLRVQFTAAPYFSTVLDIGDASNAAYYRVATVAGTTGLDGIDVRPVSVVAVAQTAASDIALLPPIIGRANVFGEVLDLTLDRPMSPNPAQYTLTIDASFVFTKALGGSTPLDGASAVQTFLSVFKLIDPPTTDLPAGLTGRDFANPQSHDALFDPLPDPSNALDLGTITFDEQGDYAFDEGIVSLKKRVLRRFFSRPGGFAHMPDYGMGIKQYGKKLAQAAVLQRVCDEAEKQIAREPEVAKVKVRATIDLNSPGLVRFNILIRTISGDSRKLEVPFVSV